MHNPLPHPAECHENDLPGLLRFIAAQATLGWPDKPLTGHACNRCGLCCLATQCPLSVQIFGERDLCPALIMEPGQSGCGLIVNAVECYGERGPVMAEFFGLILGTNGICDSAFTDADMIADKAMKVDSVLDAQFEATKPRLDELVDQLLGCKNAL